MDINSFKAEPPGLGNIKLFITGDNEVTGVTVSIFNCNQVNFSYSLAQLTNIVVNGTQIDVVSRTPYSTHFYYETTSPEFNTEGDDLDTGDCFLVEFIPAIDPIPFTYNVYNAILGNSEDSRNSAFVYDVDRAADQVVPKNILAILSGSATYAKFQDSNYTDSGLKNARYDGSKTTVVDYGLSPALNGAPFEAAVYLSSSADNFICSQSLSDRDIDTYLFTGTTETPVQGSSIFQFNGNKIIPVRNKKMWVKDNTRVLYVNENGIATSSGSLCTI